MSDQAVVPAFVPPAPAGQLEPDAIGVTQDTVIGMASVRPGRVDRADPGRAGRGDRLRQRPDHPADRDPDADHRQRLPAAEPVERQLRAPRFEWVGRAINPYLGFLTGWLMIAGYVIGDGQPASRSSAPSVLAVFGAAAPRAPGRTSRSPPASAWSCWRSRSSGIKITARTQVGMAAVEYVILIGFAIAGLVAGAAATTRARSRSPAAGSACPGSAGTGSLAAGLLIAVFMYTGWDGTLYVNEEVKHRRHQPRPGRRPRRRLPDRHLRPGRRWACRASSRRRKLQAHSTSALVYVAQALGGSGWAKVMALGLALSVIATTGTGIVLTARIIYGMASYRALPGFLGHVSPPVPHPGRRPASSSACSSSP